MSDDKDPGLFRDLPTRMDRAELEQLSQLRWEATIVSRLLRYYGSEAIIPVLKKRCFEATGHSRLLFTWFLDEFPNFPVWLSFRQVRYLHRFDMENFLDRFSKTPIYEAFMEAEGSMPQAWQEQGKPTGLVFGYIHGMGAAIMTDCERPLGDDSTRIVKNFRRRNLYIESLDNFLKGLAWEPAR